MTFKSLSFTSEERLSLTLKRGRIYRVKGLHIYPSSDGRAHHFIVLNYSPSPGSVLILTHGTRQGERASRFIASQHQLPMTLVTLPAGKYDIFPEETTIDCNNVEPVEFSRLVSALQQGDLTISYTELTNEDLDKIIEGVLASKTVTPLLKQPLRSPA